MLFIGESLAEKLASTASMADRRRLKPAKDGC
jgi:hypothetical protein